MKLWLDDERPAPEGWEPVRTAELATIMLLVHREITHVSLDHDLGEEKTGYDVACWIEQRAHDYPHWKVPEITCHSANPVGRKRIEMVIEKLKRGVMTDCGGNSQKGM